MMECYDRGLVTKDDLDGIELTWGNVEAICKLLKKIAFREGIGDKLAEGLKLAPDRIRGGERKYAITGKGVAITSYEPRGSLAEAVALAVNPVGELHGGRGNPVRIVFDSLTACSFLRRDIPFVFGSVGDWARPMLEGAAGWELSEGDWDDLVLRAAIMERCYCIREGYVPTRDDVLPDRFFDEVIHSKYGEPKVLDRAKFEEARKNAYLSFGLTEEGVPSRATLERLGMEFAVPVLEEKVGLP